MYEKELQRILTASQNNALTFFVGAGVSALSGAPTWKGLINAISDRLGQARKDEYSSDEYLQIPQMFYYSLGENKDAAAAARRARTGQALFQCCGKFSV